MKIRGGFIEELKRKHPSRYWSFLSEMMELFPRQNEDEDIVEFQHSIYRRLRGKLSKV